MRKQVGQPRRAGPTVSWAELGEVVEERLTGHSLQWGHAPTITTCHPRRPGEWSAINRLPFPTIAPIPEREATFLSRRGKFAQELHRGAA